MINGSLASFKNNHENQKQVAAGKIANKTLYLFENRQLCEINPQEFWQQLTLYLKNVSEWDTLFLTKYESITRAMVEEYAKLEMEIPPNELISLKKQFTLQKIKSVVKAKLPPLHVAALLGSVPLLIKHLDKDKLNTHINKGSDFEKESPLSLAYKFQHLEAFRWLIKNGADIKVFKTTECLLNGYKKPEIYKPYVKLLVEQGLLQYQTKKLNLSFLHREAQKGDRFVLQFFVELGAPVNLVDGKGTSPLFLAVASNRLDAVKYLLSEKAKVDPKIFAEAMLQKNLEMLSLLLPHVTSLSWDNFVDASENTNLYLMFLRYAAKISEKDVFNHLDAAKKTKQRKLLKILLLQKKFNINMCDDKGIPLLHRIVHLKDHTLLKICLKHSQLHKGARDANGVSILQLAVARGDTKIIKRLLKAGCDVNEKVTSDITPLHIAADRGDESMIELLLSFHADINAKDKYNKLPLGYTMSFKGYIANSTKLLTPPLSQQVFTKDFFKKQTICNLYTQGRLDFFSTSYEEIDQKNKWKIKETNMRKLMGHMFELKGVSPMTLRNNTGKSSSVSLERMYFDRWLHRKIGKQLESVQNEPFFPVETGKMLSNVCEFSENGASKTNAEFVQRIQEGKPTLVFTGYNGHAVQFVFWKKSEKEVIFGACNRHHPLELFSLDPSQVTEEMIAQIRQSPSRPKKNYTTILEGLKKTASKTTFTEGLEKQFPFEKQKVANCVFASLEGALWTLIALQAEGSKLENITDFFRLLQLDLKLRLASKYFDSHLSEKDPNPYVPDMILCETIMQELGHYSPELCKQYEALSKKYNAVPWTDYVKRKDTNKLSYSLLRKYYYS